MTTDNKNFKILDKSLPEYLPEFFIELENQIHKDNERWGDTWKERGLVWEGREQEQRFCDWLGDKYFDWKNDDIPFPWLKVAGEAMIGYIREKYLKNDNKIQVLFEGKNMKLISHEEAIKESLKDPEFNIAYKKTYYQSDIAIAVYRIRNNKSLTQKQFSEKYKIKLKKLKDVENGMIGDMTLDQLENILEKLGLYISIKLKDFSEDLDQED